MSFCQKKYPIIRWFYDKERRDWFLIAVSLQKQKSIHHEVDFLLSLLSDRLIVNKDASRQVVIQSMIL